MHPQRVLHSSLFLLSLAFDAGGSTQAATVNNFDLPGTAGTATQLLDGPAPTVTTGGPAGSFLRLIGGTNNQSNHYTFDQGDVGAYDVITASFDFRITPGNSGLADGFHFLLVPTASFGSSGDGPNPTAEEPDVAGAFGLGFDVYPGINNLSAHWNGAQRIEAVVPQVDSAGTNFRGNGLFNRAQVEVRRVGNGSNVTVTLTPDSLGTAPGPAYMAFQLVMPNMLPYENRVQFGGRTGGQNLNLDLDNVNVTSATPFTALPQAAGGHLIQDFDSAGTTDYRAAQTAQRDATVFRPGPLLKPAETGSTGAFLRLATDGVGGQNNQIAFNRAVDGGATNTTEVLQFDIRFGTTDGAADGLGVIFLPTSTQGLAGDGIASSEEPNHPGTLGIGFDVYSNNATDPAPAISLHWNGLEIADVPITDPAFGLNLFHRLQVIREPVAGGLNVTVLGVPNVNGGGPAATPVTLLNNVFVQGASNYDYRAQFSARTGGVDASHDLDNIVSSQRARPQTATTQANFTPATGSSWKAYLFGQGLAPEVRNEFASNGEFLRLTHDNNNSQLNSLVFDQQLNGVIKPGTRGITVDFDTRMISADTPADGFSMMMLPTSVYGTAGPGAAGAPGFTAEEPNLAQVFAFAIDLYSDGSPFNEVSLHWNGGPLAERNIDPTLIDLDSGAFHHVRLQLSQGVDETFATLILTPESLGTPRAPLTIFDQISIPGMNLYDYRLEFAGRTGGANMSIDLDNVSAQSVVPEPSSAILLVSALGLLARRRRQRTA